MAKVSNAEADETGAAGNETSNSVECRNLAFSVMNPELSKWYREINEKVALFKKTASALALSFLLPGCTTVVPLHVGTDFLPPSPMQVPLTVGVYHSPDLSNCQYSVRPTWEDHLVFPVGKATVGLLDGLYPDLFAKTVPVERRPPLPADAPPVDAVLEANIESFDTGVRGNLSWAEVVYRFTARSPSSEVLASWTVKGIGERSGHLPGDLFGLSGSALLLIDAVKLAMRDAAQRLQTSFFDVPEARRWARNLPASIVNAPDDAQTTLKESQVVWSVFPGAVAATAEVDRYPHAQRIMSAKIRVRNEGRRRLFVRPWDFSLELPGGGTDRPAPASALAVAAAPLFRSVRLSDGMAPPPMLLLTIPLDILLEAVVEGPVREERGKMQEALARYKESMRDVTLWERDSAEFVVHFTRVPDTATGQTLVVPVIDLDTATRYMIRIPVQ